MERPEGPSGWIATARRPLQVAARERHGRHQGRLRWKRLLGPCLPRNRLHGEQQSPVLDRRSWSSANGSHKANRAVSLTNHVLIAERAPAQPHCRPPPWLHLGRTRSAAKRFRGLRFPRHDDRRERENATSVGPTMEPGIGGPAGRSLHMEPIQQPRTVPHHPGAKRISRLNVDSCSCQQICSKCADLRFDRLDPTFCTTERRMRSRRCGLQDGLGVGARGGHQLRNNLHCWFAVGPKDQPAL